MLPGKLGYWLRMRGISGGTFMKIITIVVAVLAAVVAIYAVLWWEQVYRVQQAYGDWRSILSRNGTWVGFMLLHTAEGAGFAVCAVLLIALRKKTAPYIGAITSLAIFLLGDILTFSNRHFVHMWSPGIGYEPSIVLYIVIALSAAAATLYWLAHCEPERLRETCGRTAVTTALVVMATFMAVYALQAWLEIYIMQLRW